MIYALDSGGGNVEEQVTQEQINWLVTIYHINLNVYGPVPSILTFHIPPPEFEELFNKVECTGMFKLPYLNADHFSLKR